MIELAYSPSTGSLVRVLAVWKRFRKVYFKSLLANMIPPVLEPLFFILGLGVGLSAYLGLVDGVDYAVFLAPGMMAISHRCGRQVSRPLTAHICAWSTSISTMLSWPARSVSARLLLGEVLWVSSKAAAFSLIVVGVTAVFGLVQSPGGRCWCRWPGFATGTIYALMGMIVTSKVREMNNFQFLHDRRADPAVLFLRRGVPAGPASPGCMRALCYIMPLTHVTELMRSFCLARFPHRSAAINALVCLVWIALLWPLAHRLLRGRIVV